MNEQQIRAGESCADLWVQERISQLSNPMAPVFNKSLLVGKTYGPFFAPDQPLFPGHNKAGFLLDDNEPYAMAYEVAQSDDVASKIFATDDILMQYFFSRNPIIRDAIKTSCGQDIETIIGDILGDLKLYRNMLFYEENNDTRVYSINKIRGGQVCTETTAMAHNLLLLLGVPNLYCIDQFSRHGEGINATSEDHNSLKHSFIILKFGDSDQQLFIYDPNEHDSVDDSTTGVQKIPLLFPIHKDNSSIIGSRLVSEFTTTHIDRQQYRLEYEVSNLPKAALELDTPISLQG
ncbi:hypothetical protein FACS189431_0540 [Alphaproteobacteria bacterium]|nr:hypothetical protein FACS189431_0540 [Alphaproteobacteria bacterium]